jgi:chromosome segregation ATPase
MAELIEKLLPWLVLTVFGGVIALMFFFVRGYFRNIKEKVNKLDEKQDAFVQAMGEVSTSLSLLAASMEKIPDRVENNGLLIAKVDGQMEFVRKDIKDASEKVNDAIKEIKALWRFADGAHKRASDAAR